MMRLARLLAALALVLASPTAWAQERPSEPSGDRPKFEVSAVVIKEEGTSWVLMAEPKLTQGAMRMVAEGAMIGPYRLVEVAPDHVVMQGPSGPPFRVPFSWRGGEGAPASAGRAPQEPAKASRPRGERREGSDESDEGGRARRERRRPPPPERAAVRRPAPPADPSAGSEPSRAELLRGLDPAARAQVEEFLRLREEMLQKELADQELTGRE